MHKCGRFDTSTKDPKDARAKQRKRHVLAAQARRIGRALVFPNRVQPLLKRYYVVLEKVGEDGRRGDPLVAEELEALNHHGKVIIL